MLNKGTTGTIFITSLIWRGPWLRIEPGTSHTRSQHSITRLFRRRCFVTNSIALIVIFFSKSCSYIRTHSQTIHYYTYVVFDKLQFVLKGDRIGAVLLQHIFLGLKILRRKCIRVIDRLEGYDWFWVLNTQINPNLWTKT